MTNCTFNIDLKPKCFLKAQNNIKPVDGKNLTYLKLVGDRVG